MAERQIIEYRILPICLMSDDNGKKANVKINCKLHFCNFSSALLSFKENLPNSTF